jgi:pantetheine-phosphate adenylyltransferase
LHRSVVRELNEITLILLCLNFKYEFQLAGMNRKLDKNIETIFLMSDVNNQIISSRLIKEIIELKGNVKKFTTKSTINSLKKKYE